MNLAMYQREVFENYISNSQIARVLSENWFSSEMYCPCCLNGELSSYPNNTKVADFFCEKCENEFQLKSSKKIFGKKVVDGEFHTMISFIQDNRVPNFFLMRYSSDDWTVKDLVLVPRFFVSSSIIEKRNPLSAKARRAGWTGCNLLIDRIPKEGRIGIVKNQVMVDKSKVNKVWRKMSFLGNRKPDLRGWTSDVLKCVEELKKREFELAELYEYENYLKNLHPSNLHIRAKIRQQLQILRDNNVVKFESPGKYSLID